MIEEVVAIDLPVHERMVIKKNRLEPAKLNGKESRLSIVSGIHGDELDGQFVCYEVIRKIKNNPEKLKGIVDVYPDANPLGIDIGTRGIPMFDLDMNRSFPGDNNGAVAEYAAAGLIDNIIGSDICLDIHSSNVFIREVPQVRMNEENMNKLLPYAKMLNSDFVWVYPSLTVLDATLAYSLNNMGVPALVVEMGVGQRINNEYCRQLLDGIFNLMINMGIWEDTPIKVKEPTISTGGRVELIRAMETGLFVSAIEETGPVTFGTHIGDVIEPIEGRILQHIEAPSDGIIITLREHPVVYKGSLLARIYQNEEEKDL